MYIPTELGPCDLFSDYHVSVKTHVWILLLPGNYTYLTSHALTYEDV